MILGLTGSSMDDGVSRWSISSGNWNNFNDMLTGNRWEDFVNCNFTEGFFQDGNALFASAESGKYLEASRDSYTQSWSAPLHIITNLSTFANPKIYCSLLVTRVNADDSVTLNSDWVWCNGGEPIPGIDPFPPGGYDCSSISTTTPEEIVVFDGYRPTVPANSPIDFRFLFTGTLGTPPVSTPNPRFRVWGVNFRVEDVAPK